MHRLLFTATEYLRHAMLCSTTSQGRPSPGISVKRLLTDRVVGTLSARASQPASQHAPGSTSCRSSSELGTWSDADAALAAGSCVVPQILIEPDTSRRSSHTGSEQADLQSFIRLIRVEYESYCLSSLVRKENVQGPTNPGSHDAYIQRNGRGALHKSLARRASPPPTGDDTQAGDEHR